MSAVLKNIQNFAMKNSEAIKVVLLIILVGALIYLAHYGYKNKENFYMQFAEYSPLTAESNMVESLSGEGKEEVLSGASEKSDELSPQDLLPKTDLDVAFEQDKGVMMGNFVIPDLAYPVDTIGSSGKKANYTIRPLPLIPVNMNVSPWLVSTYEPDLFRKPLE
jgi:hypothetical protein